MTVEYLQRQERATKMVLACSLAVIAAVSSDVRALEIVAAVALQVAAIYAAWVKP